VLKRVIEETGCEVDWVREGADAFARIAANEGHYDVLITDHDMPDYSGLGLVSKLRDTGYSGHIIVFSARLTEADREVYRSLAVDHILDKPASFKVLVEAVRAIVERTVV